MFDAVLREQERELRYGAGLVLALLVHAAAFGVAAAFLPKPGRSERVQSQFPVTLESVRIEPPPPPPPPPPGPAASDSAPSRAVVRPTPKPVEPRPVETQPIEPEPIEKRIEPEPQPAEPVPGAPEASAPPASEPSGGGGVVGGVSGGVQEGIAGGRLGGVVGGTGTGAQVLPFGPGMTRPRQIAGGTPSYSREALAARVEGKVLVRCVIQTSGEVQDCQVLKGVPMLTDVVLASLRTSRFSPVIYRGVPQAIQYLFTFNFKLP